MAHCGYDKERFPNLQGEIFDCLICQCVVKDPKECSNCGNLFCGICIDDWMKKNKYHLLLFKFMPQQMRS